MKKIIKKIFWFFSGINRYNWFYRLIALIGLIVRVAIYPLIFPDTFEVIAEFFISQLGLSVLWYQILLRIVLLIIDALSLSNIFYFVSFATVGNSYESGSHTMVETFDINHRYKRVSHAWWGSLCYTLYYGVYMAMAGCIAKYFYWWVIAVAFSSYVVLSVGIYLISAFGVKTLPDNWYVRLIFHCIIFAIVVVGVCLLKYYCF